MARSGAAVRTAAHRVAGRVGSASASAVAAALHPVTGARVAGLAPVAGVAAAAHSHVAAIGPLHVSSAAARHGAAIVASESLAKDGQDAEESKGKAENLHVCVHLAAVLVDQVRVREILFLSLVA